VELRYFRDVERREVDFVIMKDDKPLQFIECKSSRRSSCRSLKYLKERFPQAEALQIDLTGKDDILDKKNIRIQPAAQFLADLV
jgi:hypothetical protein